jgi:hypothetical protein
MCFFNFELSHSLNSHLDSFKFLNRKAYRKLDKELDTIRIASSYKETRKQIKMEVQD